VHTLVNTQRDKIKEVETARNTPPFVDKIAAFGCKLKCLEITAVNIPFLWIYQNKNKLYSFVGTWRKTD